VGVWVGRLGGFAAVAALVFVSLGLVACSGGGAAAPSVTPSAAVIMAPSPSATPSATSPPSSTPSATPPPNREGTPQGNGTFVVACGDVLAPVDKQHRLSADCEPPDLVALPGEMSSGGTQRMRQAAAAAYGELFAAAQGDGFTIFAASAYRSYATQVQVYAGHVANQGQAGADRVSARPGHSEHQMGTTTDVTSASAGFGLGGFEGTPEAAWLAENSWRFGFIISYPEGKEAVTGYVYEPWHIRWVGVEEAKRVRESGLTLHEWLLR